MKRAKQIELYDFVRPRHESGTWRVIDISRSGRITAELRANSLTPREVRRVSGTADLFTLLGKASGND
ncbi:hypothetical protein [Leptolyngbya ohadii]|uniref:hypothetical protein n=1 Tax=Leptolyngbya ohadii TaxID=1962290 RepID=UPI000B59A61A|nr:hypothetical protein [Leptolyngbya ohadii]